MPHLIELSRIDSVSGWMQLWVPFGVLLFPVGAQYII